MFDRIFLYIQNWFLFFFLKMLFNFVMSPNDVGPRGPTMKGTAVENDTVK